MDIIAVIIDSRTHKKSKIKQQAMAKHSRSGSPLIPEDVVCNKKPRIMQAPDSKTLLGDLSPEEKHLVTQFTEKHEGVFMHDNNK